MSIFWLGGSKRIVPAKEILPAMYQDRYFLPGVIHGGEDYVINVYLNDAKETGEPEQFEVNYFTKDLIMKAHEEDPTHGEAFLETLLTECESFACDNDGDESFAGIIEAWPESISMSNSDLVSWATGTKPFSTPYFRGTINLSDTCDITDPCYTKDVWCRHTAEPMLPGRYHCYAKIEDCEEWGDRTTASWIIHEDYDFGDIEEILTFNYEEATECGVDTGMLGYFDNKPDFTDRQWHDFCKSGIGIPTVANGAFDGRDGFYTPSGYGDGIYIPLILRNDHEQVIGIYTEFIFKEDE